MAVSNGSDRLNVDEFTWQLHEMDLPTVDGDYEDVHLILLSIDCFYAVAGVLTSSPCIFHFHSGRFQFGFQTYSEFETWFRKRFFTLREITGVFFCELAVGHPDDEPHLKKIIEYGWDVFACAMHRKISI